MTPDDFGKIQLQGTYAELQNDPYLIQLKNIHEAHRQEIEEVKANEAPANTHPQVFEVFEDIEEVD